MHKLQFLTLSSTLIFASFAYADEQIDRIEKKVDRIEVRQDVMIDKLENNPLKDKKYGVEFNIARALNYDETRSISGAFSLFDVDRSAEIVFPVFYGESDSDEPKGKVFTIDAQYRKFLGETQNGWWVGGFARYAHISGVLGEDGWYFDEPPALAEGDEDKLGVGVGIGYRVFSKNGLYWGTGINVGTYLIGKNDKFASDGSNFTDDSKFIVDIDLLKIGYSF